MNKEEFLKELESRLQGLPKGDIKERVDFYSEMIDDIMEDGKTEEEAIEKIGPIDKIVSEIASDTKLTKLVKERLKPKKDRKGWEIALIILGFPLWFPLLLIGLILMLVAYVLVWILVIITYSLELSFAIGALGGLAGFFVTLFNGASGEALAYIALAMFALGLAILFIFVCKNATIVTIRLAKWIALKIKKSFIGGKKDD